MQSSQRLKLRGLNLSTAASVCERPPRVEVIVPIVNDWSGQSHQGSACLRGVDPVRPDTRRVGRRA